ncbi:MAG: CDP-diacylglycerol--serine O-phosphatidyltransferase [Acidobacteria bacterium]|nr:MAG: CDP-diacylglycerol--serine O-phosphatidyltransferase [Acidobacteriota bacterium]
MKGRNGKLPRRGVYLLPAAFTVANVFCGFYSIISSIRGELALAGILIGLGILLDTLDGRVARFANASSDFGKEFDSLADQTSFGIAPMVLAHEWGMNLWPRMGWLIGFLFVICGAMRLARFNIQQSSTDKRFFIGLPIPAAAAVVASIVYRFPEPMTSRSQALPLLVLVLVLSLLMVSKLRYYSFKDFDIRRRQPHLTVLFLALLIVTVFTLPQAMLLILASTYLVSGLLLKLSSLFRVPKVPAAEQADPKET